MSDLHGVFAGKGWWPLRVRCDTYSWLERDGLGKQVAQWCQETLGEENVEWQRGGYDLVFRVRAKHRMLFMLTWG